MRTFADLIDDFGGAGGFSSLLGIKANHARTMKARNSVPPEYWGQIIAAADAKGISDVSIDTLSEMRARLRSEPAQ